MPTTSGAYRAAVRLGVALAPTVGFFSPRLRAGIRARREAGDRLLEWARWQRDEARPTVWFHAASVGEGLQAESVLTRLRLLRPDCQIVYTHFSPSAEALARKLGADASDYLPYDLPGNVDRLLHALEPDLVVFAKLDLWPELSTRAATSGAAVAIVAATVSPGSGRLRWPARALLEPGYRAVTAAGAISNADAGRLARLGVEPERIAVLGDPRFDSVAERVHRVSSDEPLLRFSRGAPTLVAGSTWPADERVILSAFALLRRTRPEARLVVVPHEPTPEHLAQVEQRAAAVGLPQPVRLSNAGDAAPLLLVDRVGVLAGLYGAGSAAYVGGGFGHAGLHSVLEPAAWSLPVVFGPRWQNSRDAALLLEAAAAASLPAKGAVRALREQWERWIMDASGREAQGRRARAVVDKGVGAAGRSAVMLESLISSPRPHRSPTGGSAVLP
ncbi:MAG TPA: glycosyltransferase N-terminal domain-containing protein [Gemmatimonadales bacterium]